MVLADIVQLTIFVLHEQDDKKIKLKESEQIKRDLSLITSEKPSSVFILSFLFRLNLFILVVKDSVREVIGFR